MNIDLTLLKFHSFYCDKNYTNNAKRTENFSLVWKKFNERLIEYSNKILNEILIESRTYKIKEDDVVFLINNIFKDQHPNLYSDLMQKNGKIWFFWTRIFSISYNP